MKPVEFYKGQIKIYAGDCIEVMKSFPDNSFDSAVTDAPYHLTSIVKRFGKEGSAPAQFGKDGAFKRASTGFMGKEWDGGDIAFTTELWSEVYRVLKPGAHLVAFSASKNYHRMAVAIEDSGFEIRDQIMYLYGTGFPKSQNISKMMDKMAGAEREVVGPKTFADGSSARKTQRLGGNAVFLDPVSRDSNLVLTKPMTDEAKQWDGWGSALKPAHEPICFARKPLSEKTIAANVLKWGTGAINIDACRVSPGTIIPGGGKSKRGINGGGIYGDGESLRNAEPHALGRWPANVCHDGSDEVLAAFPHTKSGVLKAGTIRNSENKIYGKGLAASGVPATDYDTRGDEGSAARFFYSSKANKTDRNESKHPTVKPISLMEWLVTMVTPPGGTTLDMFAGSGTTGQAAINKGFRAVLIEREAEYIEDIKRRFDVTRLSDFD